MDTQALMDLCTINEESPHFDLGVWATGTTRKRTFFLRDCGTAGCLIGNFCLSRPDDRLRLGQTSKGQNIPALDGKPFCNSHGFYTSERVFADIAERFGITPAQAVFLFHSKDKVRNSFGKFSEFVDRNCNNREAAIRRVRKFIFYKLHKRELCYDENGCVRESIRRAEGNHNVARSVLEKVDHVSKTKELCHA